jgi:ketosteroid isomerase-like protein
LTDTFETDARETYRRFVALRDAIDQGGRPWSALADFFTQDAVYIDPAWGRVEGREQIREFFEKSMAGLTGHGWSTPENWTMVEGQRLISQWDQILGH